MESTNLNVLKNTEESFADNSIKTREVPFADDYSEELFGYKFSLKCIGMLRYMLIHVLVALILMTDLSILMVPQ
jgi:hypothetical protein